jgi:transposase-like protein
MSRKPFSRKRHTPAFRVEAVRVMQERLASGLTLQRISEELDVGPDLLRVWAKQVAGAPPGASPEEIFPGAGRRRRFESIEALVPPVGTESPEAELRRLRRENERLRQERDFLKKAAAFFAKESR